MLTHSTAVKVDYMYGPASGVYYFSSLESSLLEWLSDNLISDSYVVDVLILYLPPSSSTS